MALILGLGTDIVVVARIGDLVQRHGNRFLDRCFREGEQAAGQRPGATGATALAARWAAKEAFLKALGRDVRRIPYRDVEVVGTEVGPVQLRLHGRAAAALADIHGDRVHLSISHQENLAVAMVVIESDTAGQSI